MKQCLAIGYFGNGNLGDEASLAAMKKIFEKAGFGVSVHTKRRNGFVGLFSGLKKAETIVFTGGNLLQNETSFASLLYYVSVCFLAKAKSIPYVFLSSGIGPIRGCLAERLCRFAVKNCAFFGARTEFDRKYALHFGAKEAWTMPDLCFLYATEFKEKNDCFVIIPKRGGSLSEAAVSAWEQKTGLSAKILLLFPAQDGIMMQGNPRTVFTPHSAEEAISLLADCKFAISERLHGGILSLLAGSYCLLPKDGTKCEAFVADCEALSKTLSAPPPNGFLTNELLLPSPLPKRESFRLIIAEKRSILMEKLSLLLK